jgi:hypothetical protein
MSEKTKNQNASVDETKTTDVKPAPKKRGRAKITVGIIVAVLVVACAGGWAWHNTPSFCGTLCHNTMSEHLENFNGTDESGGAGLASVHAKANLGCLDCHVADLESQITELQAQITGTYGDLTLGSRYYVDNDQCLSCHGGSYDALAEETADLGSYNPHEQVHGQMNCNECHKGHVEQVNTCGQCHDNGGQSMLA